MKPEKGYSLEVNGEWVAPSLCISCGCDDVGKLMSMEYSATGEFESILAGTRTTVSTNVQFYICQDCKTGSTSAKTRVLSGCHVPYQIKIEKTGPTKPGTVLVTYSIRTVSQKWAHAFSKSYGLQAQFYEQDIWLFLDCDSDQKPCETSIGWFTQSDAALKNLYEKHTLYGSKKRQRFESRLKDAGLDHVFAKPQYATFLQGAGSVRHRSGWIAFWLAFPTVPAVVATAALLFGFVILGISSFFGLADYYFPSFLQTSEWTARRAGFDEFSTRLDDRNTILGGFLSVCVFPGMFVAIPGILAFGYFFRKWRAYRRLAPPKG
ncbi:MAG: hypothetical protein PCFJNLEI_01358 [Verrucomicrobiae bacterium]|nr:hypothetical protein [Verrucomicrobiae bacterium]